MKCKIPHSIKATLVLVICVTILTVACLPTRLTGTKSPTPTAHSRTTIKSGLPLREAWRKTLLITGDGSADTPSFQTLIADQDAVYAVEYDPTADAVAPLRVVALNVMTGDKLWETGQQKYIHSMALGAGSLFVASASGVNAYRTVNGQLRWISTQSPPNHEGYYLSYDDPQLMLIVAGLEKHLFTNIDLNTGQAGNLVESDSLVALDSQFRYQWNGKEFWLEDIATNTIKWIIQLPSRTYLIPIRSEETLVLPTVTSKAGWHSITAVDRPSGRTKWQCSDCYASDVAVDSGTLYAISRDGSLAAYDLKTGQLRGTIQFAGGRVMEPLNTQYSVAATNGFVFLYFGDSHELIALGPGQ